MLILIALLRGRRRILPGLLLLLGGIVACSPEAPAPTATDGGQLGEVLRRGTLMIATDPAFPPQSELLANVAPARPTRCATNSYTANQLRGLDIDVAVEVSRRLGVEPCFVTPPWAQIVSGNWNDRWDVHVGSMSITGERLQWLYFTQPYLSGGAQMFVYRDSTRFQSPADLSGRRIGTCAGCAYENYLNGTLTMPGQTLKFVVRDATVVGYDTDTSALADLAQGDGARLDAVLTDPDTGRKAIADGLAVKPLGEPVYRDYVAISLDKHSSADALPLVIRLSQIIRDLHSAGFLSALSLRYYQYDAATPASQYDLAMLAQYPQR